MPINPLLVIEILWFFGFLNFIIKNSTYLHLEKGEKVNVGIYFKINILFSFWKCAQITSSALRANNGIQMPNGIRINLTTLPLKSCLSNYCFNFPRLISFSFVLQLYIESTWNEYWGGGCGNQSKEICSTKFRSILFNSKNLWLYPNSKRYYNWCVFPQALKESIRIYKNIIISVRRPVTVLINTAFILHYLLAQNYYKLN